MVKEYKAMTVYKASAGSGKTFTLAVRFIELLIQNPEAYKQTLAVTFTNKATEEMKQRILGQLYGISRHLPDSQNYLDRIAADLGLDEDFICLQAGKALTLMLHDYSNFNIETIDAFFQKVLRNLAREMNLNANLRVELNDTEIEEKAVDKLIADLTEDNRILTWILGYIHEQMEDDKSWNVITNIKKFGRKIFSDDYKRYSKQLQERFDEKKSPGFFNQYNKMMRTILSEADKTMNCFAEKFYSALEGAGFSVNDLSNKANGASGFFKKLADGNYTKDDVWNKRAQDASESARGWVSASTKESSPLYQFAEAHLVPLINEANTERLKLVKDVTTAKAILKNLNELRLLSHIKETVNAMNSEENRFLLSDTQDMLNRMMVDSDAPFIFEKIGEPLTNIMIDEFQDTSTIQWQNFSTLLHNCIAKEGSQNLIVGDVKQSIYRWRNGDWDLLQSKLEHDPCLNIYGFEPVTLKENYRSEGNIIRFNNEFFMQGALQEAAVLDSLQNPHSSILRDIYKPELVRQEIPQRKERLNDGLVDIRLLATAADEETGEREDFNQRVMAIVEKQLQELFACGAKDEDICILARDNGELTFIAEHLQEIFKNHTFVSDEAFKLNASFAVRIIITAIRVLNHPSDKLAKAQLAKLYQEKILCNAVTEVFFREESEIDKFLPADFVNNKTMLLTRPLTNLAEELSRIFQLKRLPGEVAYLMAFYDQLDAFSKNNNPDLELLLTEWEESMHKKTVKGGSLTGVRLLTIHKSKGLEADHILLPFCDWPLDRFGSDLWCQTDVLPFANMPVVPVNSRNLKNSHFEEQYLNEQLQVFIDNMNLLYVAFTRARKNLFIIGRRVGDTSKNTTRSALIQRTLPILVKEKLPDATLNYDENDKSRDIIFTYGTLFVDTKHAKLTDNVFCRNATPTCVEISDEQSALEFRQSNASHRFAEPDEDNSTLAYTSIGTILHNVLARIKTAGETEKVLHEFEQDGRLSLSDPELNRERMAQLIKKRIEENPITVINRWFSPDVEVFNECTLVGPDPVSNVIKEFRPDRVVRDGDTLTVIDYKFGVHKDKYEQQVQTYMHLLHQMGYRNIRGFLWYVYKNSIKEVNFTA